MANIRDLLPVLGVLIVASMLISVFFLINAQLKENAADAGADTAYWTTTSYVAVDQLNSTTNLTIKPAVKNWVCFNASGAAEAFAGTGIALDDDVFIVVDPQFPETSGIVNNTDRYDGVAINCSFNTTDFGAPIWKNLNETVVSIGEWNNWTGMIIVIFAAALIIGLIFVALVTRRAM